MIRASNREVVTRPQSFAVRQDPVAAFNQNPNRCLITRRPPPPDPKPRTLK